MPNPSQENFILTYTPTGILVSAPDSNTPYDTTGIAPTILGIGNASADPANEPVGPVALTGGTYNGVLSVGGGFIQSANFVTGSVGWQIKANGDAEFNNGTFRGALTASTIDIGGNDSTSFHVDTGGNMWLGSGTLATAPFKVSSTGTLTFNNGSTDVLVFGTADSSRAINLTLDTTTVTGILITTSSTGTTGLNYANNANVLNRGIIISMTGTTNNTNPSIEVTRAGSSEALRLTHSGTGDGILISQSGTGVSLKVSHSGDAERGVDIQYSGRVEGFNLEGDDTATAKAVQSITGNASTSTVPVVRLIRDNAATLVWGTYPILELSSINNTGNTRAALNISMTKGSTGVCHAIAFENDIFVAAAVGGTQNRKIRVLIDGATYFIPAYDA